MHRDRDDRGRRRVTSQGSLPRGEEAPRRSRESRLGRPTDEGDLLRRGPRGGRPVVDPRSARDPEPVEPAPATRAPRQLVPTRRRHPVRQALGVLALLLAVWLVATGFAVWDSWRQVGRTEAMPIWEGRPEDTSGRNYLLVGSDARDTLSPEERRRLGTGNTEGRRTDTIMLVHVPTFGEPTLVSIPRDSYVPIRGMGENKINASYNVGGAPLLVDTVEQNTGLRIDGYVEIGFGGFTHVVDELGGVELCPDQDIQDGKAHLDLKAGCQEMDGVTALSYVRARYFDPRGDLGRVERQREFLSALSEQVLTPGTVLLPWEVHGVGSAVTPALTVDEHDSMLEVASALNGVRRASGGDRQVTVPVADSTLSTPHGWAVSWDEERAGALWQALREGDDLPQGL
ncbi:transcriptional attenuator, LytR family [Kytococcus aerolatus]|uniref:Transcriptional attenuator, LytR family n=2 Tax=Kytococcus aerolatus TaxID=592308 RepID=A0A212TZX2_9MICO|nr:transcriptional attenuator, LytR family [Kytococcus aerolatus]